ncbi:MAG TPA: cellulase family glycosylhydrolase, partial [Herpetosiphonaceae bacterium]
LAVCYGFAIPVRASATKPASLSGGDAARCFPEVPGVGWCIEGRFRSFWEQNGGLAVFGYPIGPAQRETTPEGDWLVQHFERERFELHPENQAPYDVLLGRLGDELLRRSGRDWQSFPANPVDPIAYPSSGRGCQRFAATGFAVCEPFIGAWRGGGLEFDGRPGLSDAERTALWGLPLSPPQWETNSSGDRVVVQWFERARFEEHGGKVLFGRLGAELALERERPAGSLVRSTALWEYDGAGLRPWTPHGINYNPAWAPWALWERWDAGLVAADLDRIAGLGANAVRVALPWRNFRGSAPESGLARDRFAEFVAMARERGLRLIPILFDEYCKNSKPDGADCWGDWRWDAEAAELALALPAAYRREPAIALWDLANEPAWISPGEWSWEAGHRANRLEWLRAAARTVRAAAPYQPLIVGVSFPGEARDVVAAGVSELISLHYYPQIHQDRAALAEEIASFRSVHLPLLVEEIGFSSSSELAGSEAAQRDFMCQTLGALRGAGAGMLWWHLQSWGQDSWEAQLGLYRADGSRKPAAEAFGGAGCGAAGFGADALSRAARPGDGRSAAPGAAPLPRE